MTSAIVGKCMKALGENLSLDSTILLSSGHKMPFFGICTSLLNEKVALETTLTTAIGVGYRQIDTEFSYGNQKLLGEILKKILDTGKVKREDLFIIDKLPSNGMTDVESFLKTSLKDLQLDYIDLYLIHSPIATKPTVDDEVNLYKDGEIAIEYINLALTWKMMEDMVNQGMVRSIGLANFNSKQIELVYNEATIKPANLQVECHVDLPRNELHAFCDKFGISLTANCPFGNSNFNTFVENVMGLGYPDTPMEYKPPEALAPEIKPDSQILLEDEDIKKLAEKHKKTPAQVFDFSLDDKDLELIASLDYEVRCKKLDFWKGKKEHTEYLFNDPF